MIEPLLPKSDRERGGWMISGIIHALRIGCRREDCPPGHGPHTTIYNRFNRWSHRGLLGRIFATLAAQAELPDELSIDSTAVRAHRAAHGGKGGGPIQAIGRPRGEPTTIIHALSDGCGRAVAFPLSPGNHADISKAPALLDQCPAPARLLADKSHDANSLRDRFAADRTEAVIASPGSRKTPILHDAAAYKDTNQIERAFRRLVDWRRIAARCDKLAINFASAVAIAAIVIWRT